MGQTLTHGIYLPDEGERNCYSGLAANWQILDSAVGTVAEHTSQIAGKAPAVHTHTKADITDLFNSANIWTGDQYFRKTLIIQNSVAASAGSYDVGINFFDSVGNRYGYIQPYITTNNQKRLMLGSDAGELSCNSDLIPANNNLNCGNSTLKWKSLNGVNPGALSLPKIVAKNTADIASAIVGSDGETQYLDGTDNSYTAALDGWISMCISGFVNNELWITVYDQQNETWGTSAESSTRNNMFIIFPIRANQKMRIRMKCTTLTYARFYPCEGNV